MSAEFTISIASALILTARRFCLAVSAFCRTENLSRRLRFGAAFPGGTEVDWLARAVALRVRGLFVVPSLSLADLVVRLGFRPDVVLGFEPVGGTRRFPPRRCFPWG